MRFSGRSATNYRAVILKVQPNRHGLAAASTRVILPIMLLMMTIPRPGISATTGRFWSYFNLASAVTPNWSFVIMPGIRYEFSRADNAPMSSNKELYFYELLTGPVYTKTWGRFTMKLPLWY